MFDLSNKLTCHNVFTWIQNVRSVVQNIPLMICGNKCELPSQDTICSALAKSRLNTNAIKYQRKIISIMRNHFYIWLGN